MKLFISLSVAASALLAAAAPAGDAQPASTRQEGFVNVQGGPAWYRVFGSGKGTPLLIVHGGPGGRSRSFEPLAEILDEARPETVARFQAMIPGARLAVIEDCGHMAPLEDPEGYAKVLRSFFKED